MLLLRLGCALFATQRATELYGAPLAQSVVLAVVMSSPVRPNEILVSRPIALTPQVASLFRRMDAPMTIKVMSLPRSMNDLS